MPIAAPRQDSARFIVFLVLIFFLYTSSDSHPPSTSESQGTAIDLVSQLKDSLNTLNTTRWQDFSPRGARKKPGDTGKYLNLTGFREGDNYRGWERLGAWHETCELFSQEALGIMEGKASQEKLIYTNVTGIVRGKWARYESDLEKASGASWPQINLGEVAPGVHWAYEKEELWLRNITGKSGKIRLRLEEKDSINSWDAEPADSEGSIIGLVREIAATITLQDESSSREGWEMRVHGVHWPKIGALVMTTTSEKFSGIFGLPHLMPNLIQYTSSQRLLNRIMSKKVDEFEKSSRAEQQIPWTSIAETRADDAAPVPHCEFVIFAQVHPFTFRNIPPKHGMDPARIVQEIEEELRFPNGAPTPKTPRLQISMAVLSPDCGFILESQGPPRFVREDGEHLVGKKQEVILSNLRHWLEIFATVIFGQTLLLKAQSKQASTPSTVGRVSLSTISMMLFADAFIFAILSLLSGTSPNIFPSALLVSFISLMTILLEIRFVSAIWSSQEPERRERQRNQPTEAVALSPSTPPNTTPLLNFPAEGARLSPIAPVTSTRPPDNNPIIIPSDQDIDAEIFENSINENSNTNTAPVTSPPSEVSFVTIYIRSVLFLTLILFLTLTSTSWPTWLRTMYVYSLSLIYLSFPAFQIHRNIQRNCRKALLWKFVIGQSLLRLAPFAYFYLIEDNIFFAGRDGKGFCILAGWLWIQCWLLAAQSFFGPRWGLPKAWYAEAWDYHPIIRDDNLEAGADNLPIGLVQIQELPISEHSPSSHSFDASVKLPGSIKKGSNLMGVDCAICMQLLEVPVVVSGCDINSRGVAGILERRRYMVTPCRHIFHSKCLEGWMRFRLQCPICRENLPPL